MPIDFKTTAHIRFGFLRELIKETTSNITHTTICLHIQQPIHLENTI